MAWNVGCTNEESDIQDQHGQQCMLCGPLLEGLYVGVCTTRSTVLPASACQAWGKTIGYRADLEASWLIAAWLRKCCHLTL